MDSLLSILGACLYFAILGAMLAYDPGLHNGQTRVYNAIHDMCLVESSKLPYEDAKAKCEAQVKAIKEYMKKEAKS